jgi:hypothetical protein
MARGVGRVGRVLACIGRIGLWLAAAGFVAAAAAIIVALASDDREGAKAMLAGVLLFATALLALPSLALRALGRAMLARQEARLRAFPPAGPIPPEALAAARERIRIEWSLRRPDARSVRRPPTAAEIAQFHRWLELERGEWLHIDGRPLPRAQVEAWLAEGW